MGKRSSYAPGVFSWAELETTNVEASKRFYAALFGWEYTDREGPDGAIYVEASLDGGVVAGIQEQRGRRRPDGGASWFNYVTVESADGAAARADELGGEVEVQPVDVARAGRMAAITDPAGALLGLWQPRGDIGAQRMNDPGSLMWNELSTSDPAGASEFYSALFGWRLEPADTEGGPPLWMINYDGAAGGINGGVRALSRAEIEHGGRPRWIPFFTVTSAGEAAEAARRAGGSVPWGPAVALGVGIEVAEVPTGRIALVRDPEGASFAIFEGEVDA